MGEKTGVGQFLAWNGGCLFIGHHRKPLPLHAHQALQVVMASEGMHQARAADADPWLPFSIAMMPANQPHAIDVTKSDFGAVILVEPETREGRAITERCAAGTISEIGNDSLRRLGQAVFAEWLEGDRDKTVDASRRLIGALAEGVEPAVLTDQRILNAISYIAAHLDRPITLDEVASHACLSPSRFRHLFVEQVGMGLRPYILWRRFILVWELLMKGGSLSAAAHAAGFADSAHLSRTSTRTFGFAPSALQFLTEPPPPPRSSLDVSG